MHEHDIEPGTLRKILRELISKIDGTMPAPRASDTDRELCFSLFNEASDEEIKHRFGMLQKGPRFRDAFEECGACGVRAAQITQFVDIIWIRQKSHVEQHVCVERQSILVAE